MTLRDVCHCAIDKGRFHLYRVTQVELAASVITAIHQPPQRVTIRLTRPNACSLPYDEPRPDPARYAARLRNRADTPSRRGDACGMTPRAALLDLVARVGARDGAAVRFIVCDKRSDINRVALTTAHVDQWKCKEAAKDIEKVMAHCRHQRRPFS